ncbi:hypothetical protein ACFQ3K_04210 [Brucella gallinifaecis]|uniref:hypothetical protein n=1 Tax=Brucella gallinifaecis TaxID=215590 RepID=UPI0014569F35|nr:hypothetical protein [Brucella gallinifaecis]
MDIQTSDALYRRHENEWAAIRNAVQQKEANEERRTAVSDAATSGEKSSSQE